MKITLLDEVADKTDACREVLRELPDWFGHPGGREAVSRRLAPHDVLCARDGKGVTLGVVVLAYHFATSAEIYWLAVRPAFHRQGIGRALIGRACEHARAKGCQTLLTTTPGPSETTGPYALTRRFYRAMDFWPLIEQTPYGPGHPILFLVRFLEG
jgi:GNAT superfamily N-acetyltransferase